MSHPYKKSLQCLQASSFAGIALLSPLQWSMLIFCPALLLIADEARKQIVHKIGSS
jgi:hypothetical protein